MGTPFRVALALAALSSLAVGACKSDKGNSGAVLDAAVPNASVVVTTDAGTADSPAPVAASASDTRVYRSFRGKTFSLVTERRGDAMRAVYYASSAPIHLRGKATDATHFSLRDAGGSKGGSPVTVTGEWSTDGTTLTATLTDPRSKKTTALAAKEGPFADGSQTRFKADFKGSLGKHFIRMKLERDHDKLTGVYRYAKSAEDITLTGSVVDKEGTFELTESVRGKVTGKLAGAFASTSCMLATWSSPDGSRTFPVDLEQGNGYPETVDLGGGLSLYPQETMVEGSRCSTDIVYPQLRGAKDKAKEAELNLLLRGDRDKVTACEEPEPDQGFDMSSAEEQSYSRLTEKNGRFLSLSQGGWSFVAGAAHPNGGATCTVIDLQTLTQFRMVDFLTPSGRDKLGDRVTESLQGSGPKLDEQGYSSDHIEIGADTNVCLTDREIRVEFARYEIAPYSMGDPVVGFAKGEVRAFFKKDELTDAVFAQ